jgi:hypothetical protein
MISFFQKFHGRTPAAENSVAHYQCKRNPRLAPVKVGYRCSGFEARQLRLFTEPTFGV